MVQWFTGFPYGENPGFKGLLDFHRGRPLGSTVQCFNVSMVYPTCFETALRFQKTTSYLCYIPYKEDSKHTTSYLKKTLCKEIARNAGGYIPLYPYFFCRLVGMPPLHFVQFPYITYSINTVSRYLKIFKHVFEAQRLHQKRRHRSSGIEVCPPCISCNSLT